METDGGTKPAVDPRFITGLSAVYHRNEKRSLFLAADQWTEAVRVPVNPFRARHVREFPDMPCTKRVYRDTNGLGPLVSSQEQRALLVSVINR